MKPLSENYADFEKTFSHVFGSMFEEQKEILVRADRVEISVPYKNFC